MQIGFKGSGIAGFEFKHLNPGILESSAAFSNVLEEQRFFEVKEEKNA
jgi:hypothetical protein